MSFTATVLRIATVMALRGATLAGERVLDAPVDPLTDAIDARGPLIAVFTGDRHGEVEGRDVLGANETLDLTIQVYLPAGAEVLIGGQTLRTDSRGSGAELVLNLIEHQITRALLAGSNEGWAGIWRQAVMSIHRFRSTGLLLLQGELDDVTSVPAREFTLTIAPLGDPPLGEPLGDGSMLARALPLLDAGGPELHAVGLLLKAEAEAPAGLPGWRVSQAALGLTLEGIRSIGLAPLDETETGDAAVLAEVTVDDPGAAP